jgi:LuxR family transcriptional regulator, quorum-sensing system regulator SolR
MDVSIEEMRQLFMEQTNPDALFYRVALHASRLGFEFCSYCLRAPLPFTQKPVIFDTMPDGWIEEVLEHSIFNSVFAASSFAIAIDPIVLSEELQQRSTECVIASKFGKPRFGISISSWSRSRAFGLLVLSRSSKPFDYNELHRSWALTKWMADTVHAAMSRWCLPRVAPEASAVLTEREREALLWSIEGKTASEIAQLIGVSERTVNFHLANVTRKLNSVNKVQAASKAVALGLLHTSA